MRKLAVVTGGTKGIGRAVIENLVQNGFDIVTCARHAQDLAELKQSLGERWPAAVIHTVKADLSKKEEVQAFAATVAELGRAVDILVNNTGFFIPGQIHNEAEGTLEAMIDTNLYSAYHLTRALLNDMINQKKGHIFMICSTASIMPYVNGGSYCISKFALYGMTKVLREEMKPHNIRVTAILPGATLTASWDGVDLPAERFMKPDDVAAAIWGAYALSGQTVVEEMLIRPQLGDI